MNSSRMVSVLRNLTGVALFLHFLFNSVLQCDGQCEILQPTTPDETKREKELLNILQPLYGSTFEVKDLVDPAHYTYKVSICSPIEGTEPYVGAFQISENGSTHRLGMYNQVDVMGGTDWIQLTYYGGEVYHNHCGNNTDRVSKLMIICDPDVLKGDFQLLEERKKAKLENCYYLFELSSSVSCKNSTREKKSEGLSSGSVFCILIFTVVSVYLLCGFLYKRIVIGAQGLEQIPNYVFWRDFGNLLADGCDYFCRWGSRHEAQAYRGIDDHLKEEEERDDALLNM